MTEFPANGRGTNAQNRGDVSLTQVEIEAPLPRVISYGCKHLRIRNGIGAWLPAAEY
jgi:hypothetical protein